ncbi:hypothetical protein [Lysobacter gummosus]|uniref:hypothetical protein n=1 Tax=Lysobacter gummosus TaxID=262324 RepID=UPI0036392384
MARHWNAFGSVFQPTHRSIAKHRGLLWEGLKLHGRSKSKQRQGLTRQRSLLREGLQPRLEAQAARQVRGNADLQRPLPSRHASHRGHPDQRHNTKRIPRARTHSP